MTRQRTFYRYSLPTFATLQFLSQAEQMVAAFFNASAVGLGVCDDQLRYEAVNETLASMNGVPADAHLGKTVRDILGAGASSIERIMKRVLTTGRSVTEDEIIIKIPSRTEIGHWIGNYFPLRNEQGKIKQVGAIVVEVTGQRRLEESLRVLTRKLLRARDQEQRRIARDLHDSVNQYHAALKMNLLRLRRNNLESAKRNELLAQSIQMLDHCLAETRTISYLLHPPLLDEMGFASATRWYVKGFGQRSGLKVNLDLPAELERLPIDVETALFRFLQEALTNVHRHAHASSINLQLQRTARDVTLIIRDDGVGISPETRQRLQENTGASGVGLASMQERVQELGGWLQIESPHQGTTLRAVIPVSAPACPEAPQISLETSASA